MPATVRKSRIRKTATAVETLAAPAPQVFELTNMEIEEVSIVDRPANEREFLLRKKAEEKKLAAAKAAEVTTIEEPEGIDLVAAAKAAEDLKALDAAAKAAEDARKAADAAKAAPVPAAKVAEVADPVAAAGALAAATKADITVSTPSGDVTVTVEDAPVVAPPAPQALIDKVKAATLAGIDAIAARVAKFRQDVDAGTIGSYNDSGRSEALWGHIWYLKDMLDSLYNIGGASWEIESAGDAAQDVDKSSDVNKAHKAITAARVKKFAAVHKCMTYAMKDFSGVLKELANDQDENVLEEDPDEVATDRVKAAATPVAVAAAKAAPVPPVVAPVPPEVTKRLGELDDMVRSLKIVVATQATEIAKARNTVNGSNAQTADELLATSVPEHDTFIWPADLAAKPTRQRF